MGGICFFKCCFLPLVLFRLCDTINSEINHQSNFNQYFTCPEGCEGVEPIPGVFEGETLETSSSLKRGDSSRRVTAPPF